MSILQNLGNGTFGPPEPYRAGPDSRRSTQLRLARGDQPGGHDRRGRRAAHARRADRPGDGQPRLEHPRRARRPGGGRFANPGRPWPSRPSTPPRSSARPTSAATEIPDMVVLGPDGVRLPGQWRGGFSQPVTYDAGPEPTGLTIADINGTESPTFSLATPTAICSSPGQRRRHLPALSTANQRGAGRGRSDGQRLQGLHLRRPGLDRVVVQTAASRDNAACCSRRRGAGRPERRRHPRPDRGQQRRQQRAGLSRPGQRPVRPGDERRHRASSWAPTRWGSPSPTSTGRPDLVVAEQGLQRRHDPAQRADSQGGGFTSCRVRG